MTKRKTNSVECGEANCLVRRQHTSQTSMRNLSRHNHLRLVAAVLTLLVVIAWSYWPVGRDLGNAWRSDDDYSVGQLVPLVAVFLAWRERDALRNPALVPYLSGGIAVVVLAHAARFAGLLLAHGSVERYALVLTIVGLVLMVAGRQVFRRMVWILLFLFLMVPLPSVIHNVISPPLRRVATTGSVVLLEAVGIDVAQQGNVIMLGESTPMAVAEACSGLRMLMAFIIVAAFIAYMVKRPRWQKAILLASSIPVAVVCNIVRIFVTAVLMLHVSSELGEKFFHDFAGYVMMPIAVMLLFGELSLMDKIFVSDSEARERQPGGPAKSIVRARKASSPDAADCA